MNFLFSAARRNRGCAQPEIPVYSVYVFLAFNKFSFVMVSSFFLIFHPFVSFLSSQFNESSYNFYSKATQLDLVSNSWDAISSITKPSQRWMWTKVILNQGEFLFSFLFWYLSFKTHPWPVWRALDFLFCLCLHTVNPRISPRGYLQKRIFRWGLFWGGACSEVGLRGFTGLY